MPVIKAEMHLVMYLLLHPMRHMAEIFSVALGVAEDGTTNGISFLSLSETAGLGMQADTDEFKSQFAGKNVAQFKYTKSGAASDEEIDALSGATITTNAVTNAVNAGLSYADYLKGGAN